MSETAQQTESRLLLPERMREPAPQPLVEMNPATMLAVAVQRGASLEQLEKFMQLKREWEADEARKAFVVAMAAFKADPPTIIKDKLVGYENKDGTTTGYKHATLGNVCEQVIAGLAKYGLSHRWDVEQTDQGQIIVTCVITHAMGHEQRTTLKAKADDSGKKNSIQQIASTVTYLSRYSLLSACGLATQDDDDGGAGGKKEVVMMTEDHQATALAKCQEVSKTMSVSVLKSYKAEIFAQIPDSEYPSIIRRLDMAQAQKEAAKAK